MSFDEEAFVSEKVIGEAGTKATEENQGQKLTKNSGPALCAAEMELLSNEPKKTEVKVVKKALAM